MSIEEKKAQIMDELSAIEDSMERLAYIIDLAKEDEPLEDEYKNDTFRIEGCMSALWLVPEFKDGRCSYRSDSDSAITKGVSSLLCWLYSDCTPEEVLSVDSSFLADVGVTQHISHNRRNGLSQVNAKIKGFAELYLNQ